MQNLNEREILGRLHVKREESKVSYEEITNPDYEVWGRAREWQVHHGACLLAGLSPIAKSYFDILVGDESFLKLLDWLHCYPIQAMDRTRLQNISCLLDGFPLMLQAKKNGRTIQPTELLRLCKNHQKLSPFLPPKLVEVIEFGSHPSLNLPNVFTSLEINPSALETLKKLQKREKKPLAAYVPIKENVPLTTLPTPPTPREAPLALAKRLFPLQDINRWKRAETLSLYETILLHYEVEPVEVLTQPLAPLPYHSESQSIKEFIGYLNRYFLGTIQNFIQELDGNRILDLIGRASQCGTLQSFESAQFPYMVYFMRDEIARWMEAKDLAFPIRALSNVQTLEKNSKISKEDILGYDLKRLDKDQLAKLSARCIGAILWKKSPQESLQQVRKHTYFKKTISLIQEITEKKSFDDKTIDDWIRNLNPNYRPKK